MKASTIALGIIVVLGLLAFLVVPTSSYPKELQAPTPQMFRKQWQEAPVEIVSVAEKPAGLGRIEIPSGTYRQGWAYDGREVDICGWEEDQDGVLRYNTHIDGEIRNDIPGRELCELADCDQQWEIVQMTEPVPTATPTTAVVSTVPATFTPVPKFMPEPTAESIVNAVKSAVSATPPVSSPSASEISIPPVVLEFGPLFLLFLAITKLGPRILRSFWKKGKQATISGLDGFHDKR